MSTRDIRASNSMQAACDVCGRTLLRGERAVAYINAGARKSVCELCESRALNEGWVKEGSVLSYDDNERTSERRPSLLSRLRARRVAARAQVRPTLTDELDSRSWSDSRIAGKVGVGRAREPRHVRAVPTSDEQKVASAVELFNQSEHRRTIAGVARSLGAPAVSVLASQARSSLVKVVVSWELCWYRYEVDLSDDQPSVRVAGQGYELDELTPEERSPTATCDEQGSLSLGD